MKKYINILPTNKGRKREMWASSSSNNQFQVSMLIIKKTWLSSLPNHMSICPYF